MSRVYRVELTIALVVVAVIVAALFLTGCGVRVLPAPRVLAVTASGAVSCARADGSGRRVLIVSPQRAWLVRVGDVCPG